MRRVYSFLFLVLFFATSIFATEFISETQKPYVRQMKINASNFDSLPATIEANCFYNVDFTPVSSATSSVVFSSLCKVDVYNERGKIGRTEMIVPDSSNHFVSKIYVPYGSTKMVIYFKNDETSEFEVYKSFELNQLKMQETPILVKDIKTGITKITIDHTNLYAVPKTLEAGNIYMFDVNLEEFPYDSYTIIPRTQNSDVYRYDLVHQNNGHYVGYMLASKNAISISLEAKESALINLETLFYSKIESNGKNNTLTAGKNFSKINKLRRNQPDKRLISYLEEMKIRDVCSQNPDEALSVCVEKIAQLTQDDFETVFLINDAIWYLVSYDVQSFKTLYPENQDYYTNLKRGVCVCEGFAKLFSQMCLMLNIPACDVFGWGIMGKTAKQKQGGRHAWNIVMIQNEWYTIDVTWNCSQYENGHRNDFYSSYWIFQKPKDFVKNHSPDYPEFQLLKKPVNNRYIEDIIRTSSIFLFCSFASCSSCTSSRPCG